MHLSDAALNEAPFVGSKHCSLVVIDIFDQLVISSIWILPWLVTMNHSSDIFITMMTEAIQDNNEKLVLTDVFVTIFM